MSRAQWEMRGEGGLNSERENVPLWWFARDFVSIGWEKSPFKERDFHSPLMCEKTTTTGQREIIWTNSRVDKPKPDFLLLWIVWWNVCFFFWPTKEIPFCVYISSGKMRKNKKQMAAMHHPLESFFGCKGEEMIWLLRVNCFFLLLSKNETKNRKRKKKTKRRFERTRAACTIPGSVFFSFLSYPVSQPWGWNGTCSFACVRACVCVRVSSGEGKKEKEKGGRCPPLTCTSSSFPFSSSSSRLRRRNRQRAQVCLSAFVCVRDTPAADVDLLLPAIYFNFFLFIFRGSFNLKAFLISFFDLLHDCPQPVNQLRNFCFLFVFWVKKTKKKMKKVGGKRKIRRWTLYSFSSLR